MELCRSARLQQRGSSELSPLDDLLLSKPWTRRVPGEDEADSLSKHASAKALVKGASSPMVCRPAEGAESD
jgi:hypothetical protein